MSIQQTTNINLIRNQLLQTLTISLNETLNAFNSRRAKISDVDVEVKNALIEIIQNEKLFIIDKMLEPFVSACVADKQEQTTFYELRNGFKANDLLNSQYRPHGAANLNLFKRNSVMPNLVQKRGFKTERTQNKEREIYGKSLFRRYIEASTASTNEPGVAAAPSKSQDDLDADLISSLMKKNTRLSELVANTASSKPTQEVDKIKQAFAEGYITREKLLEHQNRSLVKIVFTKLGNILYFGLLFASLCMSYLVYKSFFPGEMPTTDGTAKPTGTSNVPKFGSFFTQTFQEIKPEDITVKFTDVKGVDEAKLELQEIVDYLRDPEKYTRLGGRLPKGVLLVGPPGTGKTLLARAVAGEASVPFFHCSGSEFDEMFVGSGARKMRQLFQAARLRSPCVIFIDEIDSVGAKRTNSMVHPYANQTINQMLAEMDGFLRNEGIIVLGATNRRDHLDPALLRPGRFDVEVSVGVPDIKGRMEIIEYYLKRIVCAADIDVNILARLTVGLTGAHIENLVNQSALKAALENEKEVEMKHIQWSLDRIRMGAAKLSRLPDEQTNRNTAYHEAGHTLVAYFTKDSMPLHKVTIIARGNSLGHTGFAPEEKQLYGRTKSQLIAQIDVAMGGRAAEELIFGADHVTTGAGADLMSASEIASEMVKIHGMSDKFGLRTITKSEEQLSAETKEQVDSEIRKLLNDSYERAKNILKSHPNEFKLLAETLLIYETLDASDVKYIIENNKLPANLNLKDHNLNKNRKVNKIVV